MRIFSKKYLLNKVEWAFATIDNTLNSVTCTAGKYFIGGNNAKVYSSGNLSNWTSHTVPNINNVDINSVVTGRDYLMIACDSGYVGSVCVYDWTSWSIQQFASSSLPESKINYTWQKIICDNSGIYAIGNNPEDGYNLASANFTQITPVIIGGHQISVGVSSWTKTKITDTNYDGLDFINGTGSNIGFGLIRSTNPIGFEKTRLLTIGNTNTISDLYKNGTTDLDFQPTGLYLEDSNLYGIGKIAWYNNFKCVSKIPTEYEQIPNRRDTFATNDILFKKVIKAGSKYYAIADNGYIGMSNNIFTANNFTVFKLGETDWNDIATDGQYVVIISTNGLIAYKKV